MTRQYLRHVERLDQIYKSEKNSKLFQDTQAMMEQTNKNKKAARENNRDSRCA